MIWITKIQAKGQGIMEFMMHPQVLCQTQKSPTMLKSGNSWNLVSLLASSTKGGEKDVLKAPGLDQEEAQLIQLLGPASKPTTSWLIHLWKHSWCQDKPRATRTHLTHHGPNSGEATTFPHIIFFALLRRTCIRMAFNPETPKEKSQNCPGLDSWDFGSS